jgi:hypothetical protein
MSDYLKAKIQGMYSKIRKFNPFPALLGVLVWLSVPVMAQKAETNQKPVFVIVHGAWGGSWAFGKVDSLMTAKGCMVHRPSLTGLGERVHLAFTRRFAVYPYKGCFKHGAIRRPA